MSIYQKHQFYKDRKKIRIFGTFGVSKKLYSDRENNSFIF